MIKRSAVSVVTGVAALGVPFTLAVPTSASAAATRPATAVMAEASVLQPWPVLRQGVRGEPVRSLQYLLNAHGAALVVDGVFGARTNAAVLGFQRSHGLVANGVVAQATWLRVIVTVRRGQLRPGREGRTGSAQFPQPVRPAGHFARRRRYLRA